MAFIVSTFKRGAGGANARGNQSGQIYALLNTDATTAYKRLHLPPACSTIKKRPSGFNYGNRHYMVGGHTANLVVDEELRIHRQGMRAPDVAPSVAVGAGSTLQLCYTRFYDEVTGERSPLSKSASVTGNTTRTWTALPTTVPDERVVMEGVYTIAAGAITGSATKTNLGDLRPGDRIAVSTDLTRWAVIRSITSNVAATIDDTAMAGVGVALVAKPYSRASHVEEWVAVSGALPRLATRVRLGTTTIIESTATLALGIAETTSFEAMPHGAYNLSYNDRQLVAGVEGHLDTVYLSAMEFPERWEGLAFKTKYNEPIVGMFKYRDYVVLLCPDSSYKLQGYTDADYIRTVLEPDIGGLGHHGNKVAEGRAYVPGQKGIQIFNGSFHPGIPTRRREWLYKYSQDIPEFEAGYGVVDANDETYQFYPAFENYSALAGDRVWVGYYGAVASQSGGTISPVEWLTDTLNAPVANEYITFAAYMRLPGQKIGRLYRGTSEGKIYDENDVLDAVNDDYTTAFYGESIIVTPHYFFGDPGGGKQEGKYLIRVWPYIFYERAGTGVPKFNVWPGDEYPYRVRHGIRMGSADAIASRIHELAARRATGASVVYQPLITEEYLIERSGRGFSFELRFPQPKMAWFLGISGVYRTPGAASRPAATASGGG